MGAGHCPCGGFTDSNVCNIYGEAIGPTVLPLYIFYKILYRIHILWDIFETFEYHASFIVAGSIPKRLSLPWLLTWQGSCTGWVRDSNYSVLSGRNIACWLRTILRTYSWNCMLSWGRAIHVQWHDQALKGFPNSLLIFMSWNIK